MRFFSCFFALVWLCACAAENKAILLGVEPGTPVDIRDLKRHCDLGDQAACSLADSDEFSPSPARLSIVQGIAPPDRAVFTALLPKSSSYSWFIFNRDRSQLSKLSLVRPVTTGPWSLQRIEARGLEPGSAYELLAGDSGGRLVESRSFRTFSTAGRKTRIALVGGLKSLSPSSEKRIWASLANNRPDLLVFTHGALSATLGKLPPEKQRKAAREFFFARHAQARNSLSFAREGLLLPTTVAWGEDEFGKLGGDKTFPFKDQAREVLELFFPHWADESSIVDGPGISTLFQLGGHRIAVLDEYTFRPAARPSMVVCEKKGKKNVCSKTAAAARSPGSTFGNLQLEWLSRWSRKNGGPISILTGTPWVGPFEETWTEKAEAPSSLAKLETGGFAILESSGKGFAALEVSVLKR
ncbi:MAG TPA: hypothetical protein VIH99_05730 [Bdellovibrionota bacterium]|jgi:hypothetical protein